MKTPGQFEGCSFLDVHFNLRLLCPVDKQGLLKNPWTPLPGCFTGSSQVILRKFTGIVGNPATHKSWTYRLLSGVEAMAMCGWCFTRWPESEPYPDEDLLLSLAGNAFSLFAFGPLWVSIIASLGLPAPPTPIELDSPSGAESLECPSDQD